MDGCPGDGVQDISRLKYQYENNNFYDQSRYNKMFQQVVHKGEDSEINYVKIFQDAKVLVISVVNIYTEDNLRKFTERWKIIFSDRKPPIIIENRREDN